VTHILSLRSAWPMYAGMAAAAVVASASTSAALARAAGWAQSSSSWWVRKHAAKYGAVRDVFLDGYVNR
jgi:hypothetical protein